MPYGLVSGQFRLSGIGLGIKTAELSNYLGSRLQGH